MKNNCFQCESKENIPGDCHISCKNPDPNMRGNPHGVASGWFIYPWNFDPVWADVKCRNYKKIKGGK